MKTENQQKQTEIESLKQEIELLKQLNIKTRKEINDKIQVFVHTLYYGQIDCIQIYYMNLNLIQEKEAIQNESKRYKVQYEQLKVYIFITHFFKFIVVIIYRRMRKHMNKK